MLLIAFIYFRNFRDGLVKHPESLPIGAWGNSPDLKRSTTVRFILELFFTIMIIFTPVYLSEIMGFSWQIIGSILAVALLPFVFLSWPIGELADRWCGEKEFMTTGLFIMGTMLLVIPFLGPSIPLWMLVLFISRVGASLVETTTDVYFFKHVDKRDVGLISIFRLTRGTSIILGSVIGAVSMALFSFEKIFFILAVIVFLGLKETIYLKDTR
jgi:MFS family permease